MGKEKHPKRVEVPSSSVLIVQRSTGKGTIEKMVSIDPKIVATAAANMSYDSVRDFTKDYSDEFNKQMESDAKDGKVRLPHELSYVTKYLKLTVEALDRVWGVCEKYMK